MNNKQKKRKKRDGPCGGSQNRAESKTQLPNQNSRVVLEEKIANWDDKASVSKVVETILKSKEQNGKSIIGKHWSAIYKNKILRNLKR